LQVFWEPPSVGGVSLGLNCPQGQKEDMC
jgi:hypothetical protein